MSGAGQSRGGVTRRRIGIYLLGVAIGAVLVGLYHQARSRYIAKQNQQQHTPQQEPARP